MPHITYMGIEFKGQTAIITGAGAGLGRSHALELARRGAHVIVNDVAQAQKTADEINASGGAASAIEADITNADAIDALVEKTLSQHERVDILINNAGILRDKSFGKMGMDDFRAVMETHVFGAVHLTRALWSQMKQQQYGRIVFTSSPSGLYGNFGQANYACAKMALVGLMQTLAIEGEKYNIRVNALAPLAATQMTEALLPEESRIRFEPAAISAGVAALVSKDAPNGTILGAAGGGFSLAQMVESQGVQLESPNAEEVLSRWNDIADMKGAKTFASLTDHLDHVLTRMGAT